MDLEPGAVDIATVVLPPDRMRVRVASMFDVPRLFAGASFDYVFIPGTLCYAESLPQIRVLLEVFLQCSHRSPRCPTDGPTHGNRRLPRSGWCARGAA